MFITQAYAAEEATAGGAFPPFDPATFASQILWLVITFGVFYMIMSRVIIPRLAGILEVRHDRISRDLDETERLKNEASHLKRLKKRKLKHQLLVKKLKQSLPIKWQKLRHVLLASSPKQWLKLVQSQMIQQAKL